MKQNKVPKYRVMEGGNFSTSPIHIRSGKFRGVIFRFGTVKFDIIEEKLHISFTYNVDKNKTNLNLDQSKEFTDTLFLIMKDAVEKV